MRIRGRYDKKEKQKKKKTGWGRYAGIEDDRRKGRRRGRVPDALLTLRLEYKDKEEQGKWGSEQQQRKGARQGARWKR